MRWPMMMAETGEAGAGSGGSGAAGAEGSVPAPGGASDPGSGRTLLDEGGSGNLLDWRSGFPENMRNAPIIQQHPTQEGAAKTLIAQAEMIGRGIYLPREEKGTDAYNAGMQKVIAKIGEFDPAYARPATAHDYAFTLPEGRVMDGEIQGRLAQAFYTHGLTQAQVDGVMAEYWRTVSYAENIEQGREQDSFQQGRNALYAEFGANTERELTLAQRFVEHFGAGAFSGEAGGKAWEQIRDARTADGSRLINSPYLVATFAEAMRRLGEGDFIESSFYQPGQNTMQTMEARQKELTAKRHQPGGVTDAEQAELMRLNQQIVAARERQGRGRAA